MAAIAVSPVFGSLLPSQKQQTLASNYLNFTDGTNDFAQQYLPEIYEQEVERYGNRTLSGFLRMVGAEMPMTSDQVVWSEQNRLHISYDGVESLADGTAVKFTQTADKQGVISERDTIVVMNPATGEELKCFVSGPAALIAGTSSGTSGVYTIDVKPYTQATLDSTKASEPDLAGKTGLKIFVYGSEYKKGSFDFTRHTVTPQFTQYNNKPIIIRDKYAINGSDMAQIGWVEVATEDGASGYLWYLKAESETRLRFEDHLEMAVIEGEKKLAGTANAAVPDGTEGLFAAIKSRGNVVTGFAGLTGATKEADQLATFDNILKNLDTQGAIEENMLFLNRAMSLDIDDMLANISAGAQGGTAYGLFENSEEMALNLGFSGFRRGSYDFYKTDWKYLNDASTRGGMAKPSIDGVLVPAGTSTVYDQTLGTNIRRPFLHVRYRASQADDRRMKSWIIGSAGGAFNSDLDGMEVHFLSERCLVTQAANNFVLFNAA
jgi:hypothetical protein